MKTLPLPPKAFSLISSTRHIGYSVESAVADLIDNSIAAQANKIQILFENPSKPYIVILDNGCGMSEEELTVAMQYGSADPGQIRSENDLGRYGLGLKTASLSQCKKMTVISVKDKVYSARRWDLNYIEKHKNEIWPLIELESKEWQELPGADILLQMQHGTAVIWQDIDFGGTFDKLTFDDVMYDTSEHLALVFHRFLRGEDNLKKISIIINGKSLEAKDPFLQYSQGDVLGYQCKATQPLGSGKERIYLQAYVLPHDKELSDEQKILLGARKSLRRTQGFYIYRGKRLITYGNWFGIKTQGEFFKLSRILVDIPNTLDIKWSLDVKKSIAIPPREILDGLRAYVDSVVQHSKNAFKVRALGKRKPKIVNEIHVWETATNNDKVTSIFINREHPVIKEAINYGSLNEKLITLLERTIPIEAIYYSRSDEHQRIENESPLTIEELVEMLKGFLRSVPVGSTRKSVYYTMLNSDPFSFSASEINKYQEEILNEN